MLTRNFKHLLRIFRKKGLGKKTPELPTNALWVYMSGLLAASILQSFIFFTECEQNTPVNSYTTMCSNG